jgi:hypothetical protein
MIQDGMNYRSIADSELRKIYQKQLLVMNISIKFDCYTYKLHPLFSSRFDASICGLNIQSLAEYIYHRSGAAM